MSISQTNRYVKTKIIKVDTQIIIFDTIPTSPIGFSVYKSNGELLKINDYEVNFIKSTIRLKNYCDSIVLKYHPLSSQFKQTIFHKDKRIILKDSTKIPSEQNFFYKESNNYSLITNELIKRGSISRGISIGNNQNASITSSLNLQLSGKLGDNFEIVAALTDNQIPFQPSGNTQQINDFDKIYIQIFNKQNTIILGDYDILNRDNTFMQISRKAQGIQYTYKNKDDSFRFQTSNSVSKGKYNRILFNGKEGIQGPYKLSGANNEPFIVIIAGTERIYIDGKLLIRGENNDYVIDYNTAELTFTAKNPITKDKRITAEFEYSDKNYARFLTFNKIDYNFAKLAIQLQIYNEFDAKNQTIQQSLTNEEKKTLSLSGNDEWKAIVPFVYYDTTLNSNSIYYELKDTIVDNILYDSIYVYSTDTSAHYRLGFTYVGKGNGNYIQTAGNANGRVYKWVAPKNGIKQGDFEPIRKLIAPIKKTLIAGSLNQKMSEKTNLNIEFALSDHDKNLFSKIDDNHNKGMAIKASFKKAFYKNDSSKNQFFINPYFQLITKYFQTPERFRSVEFSRDWNYNNIQNNEIMSGIESQYIYKKWLNTTIGADFMQSEKTFDGFKEYATILFTPKTWNIQHNLSYLITNQEIIKTKFIRYQSKNEKNFWKIKVGATIEAEKNLWKAKENDSLLNSSFSFYKWHGYMGNNDTANAWWLIKYGQRNDFAPFLNQLMQTYKSQESSIEGHLPSNKHFQGNITLTYRQLQNYYDTIKSKDNNLTSRTDLLFRFAKNAINISTTHESNAGLEQKLSYTYIEVPAGQGVYTWIDYNHNGIKELNEFEIAQFQDQSTYIRVTSSTLNYIKVYGSRLSQIINFRPQLILEKRNGLIKKIVAALSDQLAFQQDIKTQSSDILYRLLPIYSNDSQQLSLNHFIRNTFSINKNSNIWGIDYMLQKSSNTLLLINGIDKRTLQNHTLNIRVNPNQVLTILLSPTLGKKTYESEYFSNKSFNIKNQGAELNLQYQPNQNFRITPFIKFNKKFNITDYKEAKIQTLGVEMRKNIKTDNFLTLKIDIVKNIYNGSPNSSLSYEMLEGLQPGWNQVYTLQAQRNISSTLQMIISYQGRTSEKSKMIHTGNIEMRAWF